MHAVLSLSELEATLLFRCYLMLQTNWEILSGLTHQHTDIYMKHIWSLVPLAAQKGQFFCQGNMHLANTVRGCHAVFCSLSTSHTVCRTLCYSLSKSLKHTWAFCVTAEKKTRPWITRKQRNETEKCILSLVPLLVEAQLFRELRLKS